MNPVARAWQNWWEARLQPCTVHRLQQRNIYILPTRAGWMFGILLCVLLIASINEQLSLGYALTFLLAGAAAVSVHITHANLSGLALHAQSGPPIHLDREASLTVRIDNPKRRDRWGLGFRLRAADPGSLAWADVSSLSQTQLQLRWRPSQRGRVNLPVLCIESRYPFGLFRAWSLWRPQAQQWVYPALLKPAPDWPRHPSAPPSQEGRQLRPTPGGDEENLKPYRRGDPWHRIHWKKTAQAWARGQDGISREAQSHLAPNRHIDWNDTSGHGGEHRLSMMCTWLIMTGPDQAFSMRLPQQVFPRGQGHEHQQRCLQALALFGAPP